MQHSRLNRSRLLSSSFVTAIAITGLGHLHAQAQSTIPSSDPSSETWIVQALGSYESQIWSASMLLPGTTTFSQASDGSLAGRYTMNELGKTVPGTLSQCRVMRARVARCIWTDKYGTGTLEVTFNKGFSSFDGYWGSASSKPEFRWSGSRAIAPKSRE